ncbi:hypothetical protein WDC_0678 [Paucilactobacillus wasatchensis]|uniref:Uncharacterized protein n=1 Tax=Paucilactobacillus wasatchensis TaxID=1335616 RepID=A0A0D0YWR8_9LACO|nr:hypothetical protein WDC_0678 [Paucilactobacillus wasatchensis]
MLFIGGMVPADHYYHTKLNSKVANPLKQSNVSLTYPFCLLKYG